MPMGDGPNDAGLSRHHLIRACEASLRRLGTDYIDLYQVHEWDGATPLEETLDALDDLVRLGQGALHRLLELRRLAPDEGARDLRAARLPALRLPADLLLAAGARRRVRAGAGRARPGRRHPRLEPARRRPAVGQVPPRPGQARGLAPPDRLERAAGARRGAALRHRSTCWSRSPRRAASRRRRSRSRGCSAARASRSLVIGARTEEQLADNLGAADLELADDERARLDEVSAPPLLYPYWHQAKTSSDRLSEADLTLLGAHV